MPPSLISLRGSNDIANLYSEEVAFVDGSPGYHAKDQLDDRLHDLVCSGEIGLHAAQRQIAAGWEKFYLRVCGVAPTG